MPDPAVPHMSPDQFRSAGHAMIDWIADYWEHISEHPVRSPATPGQLLAALPQHPPERAEPWSDIAADIDRLILPGLTHWQHPAFFAFFPANASGPAVLGELLSAGLGVNGMLWATSPAATELETRMLDWMAELLDLPAEFRSTSPSGGGVIQGTASESTLIAMLAARRRATVGTSRATEVGFATSVPSDEGAELPRAALQWHGPPPLTLYASTQAHSSIIKAAMIAGLADGPDDRRAIRLIGVDESFALRPDLLGRAIRDDLTAGRRPFYICATVGTTSSTAIDPLPEIARLARQHNLWLHVDAAHAGAAAICPEHRSLLRGVEHADSICFNPHKWLLTNFDCDLLWTRDRDSLTGALSITPEYLRNAAARAGDAPHPAAIDYRDWQIPLGRRFRALKLWFVMRQYGAEGLRAHIREHIRLTAELEGWIRENPRFELAAPRTVNLVCFRLRDGDPAEGDRRTRALLERINASGRAYLTHTVLPATARQAAGSSGGAGSEDSGHAQTGRFVIRMCVGGTFTRQQHVRNTWDLIAAEAARV